MSNFSFPSAIEGAYADLGGEVISLKWEPPLAEVQAGIMRIAGYLDDTGPPMRASKAIAKADIEQRFDTETDPDGNQWTDLDPEYADHKDAMGFGGNPILTLFGALRSAAGSEAAWDLVGDNELFFNAGALPDYGIFHQQGTGGGDSVGAHAAHRANAAYNSTLGLASGGAHESLGVGRGKALPARPFIGLSGDAEEQIFEVFDLWFAEGASIGIGSSGTVQERISGRYGGKIYPKAF